MTPEISAGTATAILTLIGDTPENRELINRVNIASLGSPDDDAPVTLGETFVLGMMALGYSRDEAESYRDEINAATVECGDRAEAARESADRARDLARQSRTEYMRDYMREYRKQRSSPKRRSGADPSD